MVEIGAAEMGWIAPVLIGCVAGIGAGLMIGVGTGLTIGVGIGLPNGDGIGVGTGIWVAIGVGMPTIGAVPTVPVAPVPGMVATGWPPIGMVGGAVPGAVCCCCWECLHGAPFPIGKRRGRRAAKSGKRGKPIGPIWNGNPVGNWNCWNCGGIAKLGPIGALKWRTCGGPSLKRSYWSTLMNPIPISSSDGGGGWRRLSGTGVLRAWETKKKFAIMKNVLIYCEIEIISSIRKFTRVANITNAIARQIIFG